MMKITFLGATQTVTGSKYWLTVGDKHILLDCGLYQGEKELRLRNWDDLPIAPEHIHCVILTHAHIDHSGYTPVLIKKGFTGKVYCTQGTLDLCSILLPDSGYLQEEEAAFANKHKTSKHSPALPLYTREDGENALAHFSPVPYLTPFALFDDFSFEFIPAGHIIGASQVRVIHRGVCTLFTGDMGRFNDLLMNPPHTVDETDYLITESTYGDREHEQVNPVDDLERVINRTLARGGSVLIPAFAVGRAQLLLYYIYLLKQQQRIPQHLPVYLDSPMAIDASQLFTKHAQDHKLDATVGAGFLKDVRYVKTKEESKKLDKADRSFILISASGMATGGRVLHHLTYFLGDARHTVMLAGFQAKGTRGDRLVRGEPSIKIFGRYYPVAAEIYSLKNCSAHADSAELLSWLKKFKRGPKKVFVTHGEKMAAETFRDTITTTLGWNAVVPEYLQSEELV